MLDEGDLVEAFAILKLLADGEDVSCYRDDSRRLVSKFRNKWLNKNKCRCPKCDPNSPEIYYKEDADA